VTTLRAAEKWEQSHLRSPEVAPLLAAARFFYVEGYFLTHGTDSVVELAKAASLAGKVLSPRALPFPAGADPAPPQTFALNLSAPFIPQFFHAQVQQVLPFVDILICNETEAGAWAAATGQPSATDLPALARALATQPKSNPSRPRTVIITHGAEPTIAVSAATPEDVRSYPVHVLAQEQIADTNGAGDAFAGGFMGALVAGKDLDGAVAAGQKLAALSVQEVGPQFKWPKVQIL
jgi:adenosine kinase